MKNSLRWVVLALFAIAALLGASGCSSSDTDEHGVVRSSDGWF